MMSVLYTRILNLNRDNLEDPNRNIFILSKGHIATTMFTVLAYAGIIPYEDLEKHLIDGENYAGHTRRYTVPGIEMDTPLPFTVSAIITEGFPGCSDTDARSIFSISS